MAKEATRVKKRERKNISTGVAHVNSTFNNTMITITDAREMQFPGRLPVRRASRVRASRPRSQPRWLLKMLPRRRRITA